MLLMLVVVWLLMSSDFATNSGAGSDKQLQSGEIVVKNVDLSDRDAVLRWARGICRGVSVEEIADAESIEPTTAAAVQVLVGNLPEETPDQTRKEAAQVCANELETFDLRRQLILEVLTAEVKIESSTSLSTETYKAIADQIQRHAMASVNTEQLTLAVMQILSEHLKETVPRDMAERIVDSISLP